LDEEKRSGQHRQHKPDIEVQEQVSDIESPWLRTEDFGPFILTPEDIVGDNVPGY
jgi:hypothetical protein